MRLYPCKTRFMAVGFLVIVGCLYTSAVAESKIVGYSALDNAKLFGFGGDIGYVGKYIWKGVPLTQGPCFQPEFWSSFKGFKLGTFINLFASNKDNTKWKLNPSDLILQNDSGECSQSFGMINQVNFFLQWEHTFNETFSLLAGYSQYAYGEYIDGKNHYKKNYGWFHKNVTYGELTIRPCFKMGIVNIFTEQNIVLVAPKQEFQYEVLINPQDTFLTWVTLRDSRFGSYHGVFGVSFVKELSEELSCALIIQEEVANRNFFETLYRNPLNGETVSIEGAYQRNVRFSSRYSPTPWFVLYSNCGIEFMTKETLSNKTETKGAFLFGGLSTQFSFGL